MKKPESLSRTLDSNPRASKQAPIDIILQRKEKPNNTELPDNLKTGIENLSGYSMDDVRVHYNSDKPAQLNALAYAQGTDIHIGSGQEKHLPHEAWHVVQQKQGRVQPTMQLQGVNVNDNEGLERKADVMGSLIFNNNPKRQRYETGTTSSTIQKYTKFTTANGVYFQADPGINPNPMIMIKENEAGTIYLRQGIAIPNQLIRLGINVISNNIPDPLANIIPPPPVAIPARPNFDQIRQGRIATFGQTPQPLRTHKSRDKALDILHRQLRFLNRLNGFLPQIRNELNFGNQANPLRFPIT